MDVTAAGRDAARLAARLPGARAMACDLARDDSALWAERLRGMDAVINCAGLMGRGADYAAVHDRGARALFDGARAAGVGRIIQISALGADGAGDTAYQRSKAAADDHLAALGGTISWAVLRPSLVLGRGGASMGLFTAMAALPVMPCPGRGQVQPIHIDDLVEAVLRLLTCSTPFGRCIDVVGPEAMTIGALLRILRNWLDLPPPPALPVPFALPVPRWLLGGVAALGIGPVTRESLAMLEAGNTAPVAPFVNALGFQPQPVAQALARHPATQADRMAARLAPMAAVLRWMLALVWLAGGGVSLAMTPASVSGAWLARLGLSGAGATAALWAGSGADLAVGLALIARWRGAAMAGVVLMVAYTAILSAVAPHLWADPFGPLVKNLAVLGLSLAVHAMEMRRG
jgi:uncharacterized protein YbjT (DUF2867 family)